MAHLRRIVTDPSCAIALVMGASWLATPSVGWASATTILRVEPDEDLELSDEEEEDPLAGDDEEDWEEDDPLAEDEEEAPGASGSASGSVSLGGGAEGKAKGKRSKPRKKREKGEKKVDDRPFFERYKPTNHTISVGGYLGAFMVSPNHTLFDRGEGMQPTIKRGNFDLGLRIEYMGLPYVGVGFETGLAPTVGLSENNARANVSTVRGHVIGALPYRLTPTLVVGGGLLQLASKNETILNGGNSAFHWGPGAKFHVNDWVAVRIDGRHIVASGNDGGRAHHGEILFGAEVTVRLTKWVGHEYRAKRTDSDGDTITDFYDKCPDEPGDDEDGCPRNRDGDNDGIVDSRDACPTEWGDGPDGCPVPDKDGDGILDIDDSCVDEAEVYNGFDDTDGCPDDLPDDVKAFEGVIQGIYFDSGKATVKRRSFSVLNKAVKLLEKYPSLRLEISGHTDSKGSHEDNMKLSQERADAVREYLVGKGIDEGRLQTRGAGPDEPIADNDTKSGRAKNRRIEFKVVN